MINFTYYYVIFDIHVCMSQVHLLRRSPPFSTLLAYTVAKKQVLRRHLDMAGAELILLQTWVMIGCQLRASFAQHAPDKKGL